MNDAANVTYIILFVLILTVWFVVKTRSVNHGMTYVRSDIDGASYLVRNVSDKKRASNLLASIKSDIMRIVTYLDNKVNQPIKQKSDKTDKDDNYHKAKTNIANDYKSYVGQLMRNIKHVQIKESDPDTSYTSYTINKGESIVFCIRSKTLSSYMGSGSIHDKNLVMYVALHEISHVACPEYGHTKLFKDIFRFITEAAMELGIYTKIDFARTPTEYCGMTITDSIV